MADPVFDEEFINHLLRVTPSINTVDALQSGAAQALVDLYDRKVTREEFIACASQCLSLYSQTAKLWMLHNIKHTFDEHGLTAEKFELADKQMVELLTKQAQGVMAIVDRLMQCPTSQDKVH